MAKRLLVGKSKTRDVTGVRVKQTTTTFRELSSLVRGEIEKRKEESKQTQGVRRNISGHLGLGIG